MRENWKYQPLGEIVEIKRGLTYSKNDEVDISGKIVLRSNNVNLDNHQFDFTELKYLKPTFDIPADKYLQKGDLLMCMSNGSKAHLGKVALYDGESDKYAFGGFMAALSHKDSVIGRYLFYAMITPMYKEYIKTLSDGANINNLKVRDIEAFSIPVPPLSEQERIVALLDDQFAKIDTLKANAASQLQDAKDLFQSALKEMLTPQEGWEHYTINDVISDLRTGLNPRVHFKLNTPDADCYYITVRELKGFTIEVDEKTDLVNKEAIVRINQRSHLQIGDVLFSATGTIGNTALVKEIPQNWNIKEGIYVMTPRKEKLNSKYFIYLLSSDFFLKSVRAKAEGTGVKSIAMKNLVKFPISFPSLPEQERIAARLDTLSDKVARLQANYDQTITLCNDLKQALLKSIFE